MAKKKEKPQVINNIGELNLDIDCNKLAQAIVKAQEESKEESKPKEKIVLYFSCCYAFYGYAV